MSWAVLSSRYSHLISHLSLNREGRWRTTDNFATSFLHFSLFSTAFWDLANSRPVHSLMLSSHLFLCQPCLLPPFHSRAPKKNTSHENEVLLQDTSHLIQRPCYHRGSPCQDPAGNRTTRRPLDHRKETQTAVHTVMITGTG